jgi:hypothetical protein
MDRAEQQIRLIQAVYRVEHDRQSGDALDRLRARCLGLLEETAPAVDDDPRLATLVSDIRAELKA